MANRYKKNGAKERPDTYTERHRERYYRDSDYAERHELRRRGPPNLPARTQKKFDFKVPLDPKDAERLAKRERMARRIAAGINVASRTINPVFQAHKAYQSFEPILGPELNKLLDRELFSPSRVPGGVVFDGPLAQYMELKCDLPGVPIDQVGWFAGHNNQASCGLSGQASPWGVPIPPDLIIGANHNVTWVFSRVYYIAGVVARLQYSSVWWQKLMPAGDWTGSYARKRLARLTPDAVSPMLDPNVMRLLPAELPFEWPTPVLDYVQQIDQAIDEGAKPRESFAIRGGGPSGPTITRGGIGPSRPPKPGQKERKGTTTMRVLLGLLDSLSEAAEVVDAVYEALPEKTKKQWDCSGKRPGFEDVTRSGNMLDNAGQYGIDRADCKLAALWHNSHKIDLEKAVRNIIANQLQDRVIGDLSRAQPKNVGRATEEGQKAVNDLLERLFDASGLT